MGAGNTHNRSSKQSSLDSSNLEAALQNSVFRIKGYILPAILLLGFVLLLVIGVAYYFNKKKMKNAKAHYMLQQALVDEENDAPIEETKPENDNAENAKIGKLEELIKSFPTSLAAKDAQFYLAKINFDRAKFDEAANLFSKFYQENATYEPLATSARMAEANCLMAKGDFDGARAKFQLVADDSRLKTAKSGVVAQALYKVAMCEFLLGKFDKTKATLNSLLASFDDKAHTENAQSFLAKMDVIPPENMRKAMLSLKDSEDANTSENSKDATAETDIGETDAQDVKSAQPKKVSDEPENLSSDNKSQEASDLSDKIESPTGEVSDEGSASQENNPEKMTESQESEPPK